MGRHRGLLVLSFLVLVACPQEGGRAVSSSDSQPSDGADSGVEAQEALSRAQVLIASEQYLNALGVLGALDGSSVPEVGSLRREAAQGIEDRALWTAACAGGAGGPCAETLCSSLSDGSPFRSRGCCRQRIKADGGAAPDGGRALTPAEAMSKARQCMIQGDHQCCIKALRDVPATTTSDRMLMSCLDNAGRRQEACALAQKHKSCTHCRRFHARRCGASKSQ